MKKPNLGGILSLFHFTAIGLVLLSLIYDTPAIAEKPIDMFFSILGFPLLTIAELNFFRCPLEFICHSQLHNEFDVCLLLFITILNSYLVGYTVAGIVLFIKRKIPTRQVELTP